MSLLGDDFRRSDNNQQRSVVVPLTRRVGSRAPSGGLAGYGAIPTVTEAVEDDRRIGARALAELAEAERAMDEIDGGMGRVDTDEHPERIGEPLAERIRRWAGAQR